MDDATIAAIVSEIAPLLIGRAPGKLFQLTHQSLAIDFGLREHGDLFISVEPAAPRLYLIKRRVRDLEKASVPTTQFALTMRKELAQKTVTTVDKLPTDRVVTLKFEGLDELGARTERTLIAQLTGRSANLFLLNDDGIITGRLKETKGVGQTVGEKYRPPNRPATHGARESGVRSLHASDGKSYSESLDHYYTSLDDSSALDSQLAAARSQLQKEISRRKKLLTKLERDLDEHSEAEQHKQIGDLLLANVGTAKRVGSRLKLTDYFAEGAPEIEIEVDEKLTLPEEASRRFEMYSRSKRARQQITARIAQVKTILNELESEREKLESEISLALGKVSSAQRTFGNSALAAERPFDNSPALQRWDRQSHSLSEAREAGDRSLVSSKPARDSKKHQTSKIPGARRYVSSDGYEILVGRAARDNDNLTFKVAKPNDLWLHAADYPGSHVIVRNPTRKEVPHRTLVEAAQLAGYFSQASKDPKVDVHYTQRKFLSKPKGGAAGLVRMSRFKNVVVKPAEAVERVL